MTFLANGNQIRKRICLQIISAFRKWNLVVNVHLFRLSTAKRTRAIVSIKNPFSLAIPVWSIVRNPATIPFWISLPPHIKSLYTKLRASPTFNSSIRDWFSTVNTYLSLRIRSFSKNSSSVNAITPIAPRSAISNWFVAINTFFSKSISFSPSRFVGLIPHEVFFTKLSSIRNKSFTDGALITLRKIIFRHALLYKTYDEFTSINY